MLYIKCTNDYLEYFEEGRDFPDFWKKVIFNYKKIFGKITRIRSENGEVLLIPKNNSKFKKSLINYLKIYQVKTIVLSENLKSWKHELENVKILDGKLLYKYLLFDIVKYVIENKNENVNEQNIAFAVRNPDDIDFENLKMLARNCKTINLITKDEYRFKRIGESLYNDEGIILNISYNYKNSFLKSGIIINVDLDEKEFNKFALPRKSVVINLKEVKIYNKGFNGINILKYEIDLPKKYVDDILNIENFNKEILYESFIYRKTAPQNVLKKIKFDDVKIIQLLGKNGYIDKKEYSKT